MKGACQRRASRRARSLQLRLQVGNHRRAEPVPGSSASHGRSPCAAGPMGAEERRDITADGRVVRPHPSSAALVCRAGPCASRMVTARKRPREGRRRGRNAGVGAFHVVLGVFAFGVPEEAFYILFLRASLLLPRLECGRAVSDRGTLRLPGPSDAPDQRPTSLGLLAFATTPG